MTETENIDPDTRLRLLEHLYGFLTPERRRRFDEIISRRTRHITIVLEDIYQPHNASAVLRTCDCFGLQDVYIIENRNRYEVNPDVALGSAKWLSLFRYNRSPDNTGDCLRGLKDRGYRIVATTPHREDFTPETLPLDQPLALVFGTELEGLSKEALFLSDAFIKIPMFGFTESLNISVSAAVFLHALTMRLRESPVHWTLDENEKTGILLQWAAGSVKKPDVIIRDFLKKNQ